MLLKTRQSETEIERTSPTGGITRAVRRSQDKLTSLIKPRSIGSQVVEHSEISDGTYTLHSLPPFSLPLPVFPFRSLVAKTDGSPVARKVGKHASLLRKLSVIACTLDRGGT